ncbi:MAG: alpha/beta hydrolase [Planctomycetota bacterium]
MPYPLNFGLRAFRGGAAVLSRVVPPLGYRLHWSLFVRSPKPARVSEESLHFLESHGRQQILEVEGHRVPAYTMRPAMQTRMRVLLIHGWGSRAAALLPMAKLMMRDGAEVIAFDGPGSGLTGKHTVYLPEQMAVVDRLQRELGPIDVVVGHSFGGIVAAHSIAEGLLPSCRVFATIASPNSFEVMTQRHLRFFWQPEGALDYFDKRVQELTGSEIGRYGIGEALAQLRPGRLRYLCLHDHSDEDVPVSDAQEIGRALPWAQVEITAGLGHNRILREESVIRRVVEYIDESMYGVPEVAATMPDAEHAEAAHPDAAPAAAMPGPADGPHIDPAASGAAGSPGESAPPGNELG